MNAQSYCRLYKLNPCIERILEHLKPKDWHFLNKKIDEKGEIVIKTGWYSGTGAFAKRESAATQIIQAARKAGFIAEIFNISPRKGATGERVRIIIPELLKIKKQEKTVNA